MNDGTLHLRDKPVFLSYGLCCTVPWREKPIQLQRFILIEAKRYYFTHPHIRTSIDLLLHFWPLGSSTKLGRNVRQNSTSRWKIIHASTTTHTMHHVHIDQTTCGAFVHGKHNNADSLQQLSPALSIPHIPLTIRSEEE